MGKLRLRVFAEMLRKKIQLNVDNLNRSVEELDQLMRGRALSLRDWTDKRAASLPADQQDEYYESTADEYWQLAHVMPRTVWRSLFLTCYAFVEHEMLTICRVVQRERKYAISPSDLRDKGIHQAKTYLVKVAG